MRLLQFIRNRYALISLIVLLVLFSDIFLHKGLFRVMIIKSYPTVPLVKTKPPQNAILVNTNKEWSKAVNTKEKLNDVNSNCSGLEFDIYFDSVKKTFDVHHDINASTGLNFDELLGIYKSRNLTASIWIDFKNLDSSNCLSSLNELVRLRDKYNLKNKILVEASEPNFLKPFSDSSFFTSYYTPFFNPYLLDEDSIKKLVVNLTEVIKNSKVDALSGYYFQYPLLHHYFPEYRILIWSPNDRWSFINKIYKSKIRNTKEVFIALYN